MINGWISYFDSMDIDSIANRNKLPEGRTWMNMDSCRCLKINPQDVCIFQLVDGRLWMTRLKKAFASRFLSCERCTVGNIWNGSLLLVIPSSLERDVMFCLSKNEGTERLCWWIFQCSTKCEWHPCLGHSPQVLLMPFSWWNCPSRVKLDATWGGWR